jgi:hypothetical protein
MKFLLFALTLVALLQLSASETLPRGRRTKSAKAPKSPKAPKAPKSPKGEMPSMAPSVSSAPTACADSTARWPVNNVTQACAWVLRGTYNTTTNGIVTTTYYRCNDFIEARTNCPVTCGTCPCFDTTERFLVPTGVYQACAWVARKDTALRCAMMSNTTPISTLCPLTCGQC